jgi:hypothetical protein
VYIGLHARRPTPSHPAFFGRRRVGAPGRSHRLPRSTGHRRSRPPRPLPCVVQLLSRRNYPPPARAAGSQPSCERDPGAVARRRPGARPPTRTVRRRGGRRTSAGPEVATTVLAKVRSMGHPPRLSICSTSRPKTLCGRSKLPPPFAPTGPTGTIFNGGARSIRSVPSRRALNHCDVSHRVGGHTTAGDDDTTVDGDHQSAYHRPTSFDGDDAAASRE